MQAFVRASNHVDFSPPPNSKRWGAGILIVTPQGPNEQPAILLVRRSDYWTKQNPLRNDPHIHKFCNFGGSPNTGEIPIITACRETTEECKNLRLEMIVGSLEPLFLCESSDFTFYNYILVVKEAFAPNLDPEENYDAQWIGLGENPPEDLHPGIEALLSDEDATMGIRQKLLICPQTPTPLIQKLGLPSPKTPSPLPDAARTRTLVTQTIFPAAA